MEQSQRPKPRAKQTSSDDADAKLRTNLVYMLTKLWKAPTDLGA
jgi:hypothetical protein